MNIQKKKEDDNFSNNYYNDTLVQGLPETPQG